MPNRKNTPRESPREKVARFLQELGHPVHEDDFRVTPGVSKRYQDIVECWGVIYEPQGRSAVEITSAHTLTECARSGIYLEENQPHHSLYGQWVAVPKPKS